MYKLIILCSLFHAAEEDATALEQSHWQGEITKKVLDDISKDAKAGGCKGYQAPLKVVIDDANLWG